MKNIFLILLFSGFSSANDGAAGLSGGDLVFKSLKGVQMVEEDLYISPTTVKVAYVFRNITKKKVSTVIAFPIEGNTGSDTAWDTDSKNPNDFTAKVDGKYIDFKTDIKKGTDDDSYEIRHYWTQDFPANGTVKIEHSYKPIFETGIAYMTPQAVGDGNDSDKKSEPAKDQHGNTLLDHWGNGLMDLASLEIFFEVRPCHLFLSVFCKGTCDFGLNCSHSKIVSV